MTFFSFYSFSVCMEIEDGLSEVSEVVLSLSALIRITSRPREKMMTSCSPRLCSAGRSWSTRWWCSACSGGECANAPEVRSAEMENVPWMSPRRERT